MEPVEQARKWYAAELRFTARVRSSAVVNSFATVPREQFVGPGPWRIKSPMDLAEYWTTDDDDPGQVYHDVLIALDKSRGINNGQPSLWVYLLDRLDLVPGEHVLHLGCGTGYYTAIIAELVGSSGRITAVEIDLTLAQKARAALADWPQVKLIQADGAHTSFEPVDAIVASAGANHPLPVNAGEKMHQRAGVKLHHGWMPNAPTGGLLLRDKQDEKCLASPANVPETSSVA